MVACAGKPVFVFHLWPAGGIGAYCAMSPDCGRTPPVSRGSPECSAARQRWSSGAAWLGEGYARARTARSRGRLTSRPACRVTLPWRFAVHNVASLMAADQPSPAVAVPAACRCGSDSPVGRYTVVGAVGVACRPRGHAGWKVRWLCGAGPAANKRGLPSHFPYNGRPRNQATGLPATGCAVTAG